ncbi:MAG: hypothetical protein M1820_001609 [Bogoriella megaspora]|nr:MAG: hypothetical protein M1820_001609 [Bogoriella megaspora]
MSGKNDMDDWYFPDRFLPISIIRGSVKEIGELGEDNEELEEDIGGYSNMQEPFLDFDESWINPDYDRVLALDPNIASDGISPLGLPTFPPSSLLSTCELEYTKVPPPGVLLTLLGTVLRVVRLAHLGCSGPEIACELNELAFLKTIVGGQYPYVDRSYFSHDRLNACLVANLERFFSYGRHSESASKNAKLPWKSWPEFFFLGLGGTNFNIRTRDSRYAWSRSNLMHHFTGESVRTNRNLGTSGTFSSNWSSLDAEVKHHPIEVLLKRQLHILLSKAGCLMDAYPPFVRKHRCPDLYTIEWPDALPKGSTLIQALQEHTIAPRFWLRGLPDMTGYNDVTMLHLSASINRDVVRNILMRGTNLDVTECNILSRLLSLGNSIHWDIFRGLILFCEGPGVMRCNKSQRLLDPDSSNDWDIRPSNIFPSAKSDMMAYMSNVSNITSILRGISGRASSKNLSLMRSIRDRGRVLCDIDIVSIFLDNFQVPIGAAVSIFCKFYVSIVRYVESSLSRMIRDKRTRWTYTVKSKLTLTLLTISSSTPWAFASAPRDMQFLVQAEVAPAYICTALTTMEPPLFGGTWYSEQLCSEHPIATVTGSSLCFGVAAIALFRLCAPTRLKNFSLLIGTITAGVIGIGLGLRVWNILMEVLPSMLFASLAINALHEVGISRRTPSQIEHQDRSHPLANDEKHSGLSKC